MFIITLEVTGSPVISRYNRGVKDSKRGWLESEYNITRFETREAAQAFKDANIAGRGMRFYIRSV
jgi:hypothetical protein